MPSLPQPSGVPNPGDFPPPGLSHHAQARPAIAAYASAPGYAEAQTSTVSATSRKRRRLFSPSFLAISLAVHIILGSLAGYWVVQTITAKRKLQFQDGPPTANVSKRALEHKVSMQKKKNAGGAPAQAKRISVAGFASQVTLPEMPSMPSTSQAMMGRMGGMGGAGFGTGLGFGNGSGMGMGGAGSGGGLVMFGVNLKNTRKIAVVMDVSRSMTNFLPVVTKELDKVAKDSPLVLFFGCGLVKVPPDADTKARATSDDRFRRFWQVGQGRIPVGEMIKNYRNLKYNPGAPMPLENIYNLMRNRKNTYYVEISGIQNSSSALLSPEVANADTIYWFSDFQDKVDLDHMQDILMRLKGRKQKLYIHASVRGKSFVKVRDRLVIPTGGEVVETKAK